MDRINRLTRLISALILLDGPGLKIMTEDFPPRNYQSDWQSWGEKKVVSTKFLITVWSCDVTPTFINYHFPLIYYIIKLIIENDTTSYWWSTSIVFTSVWPEPSAVGTWEWNIIHRTDSVSVSVSHLHARLGHFINLDHFQNLPYLVDYGCLQFCGKAPMQHS